MLLDTIGCEAKLVCDAWTAYRVNRFKFHTEARSVGKKTYNCGVGVCGTGECKIENDYYGLLKDIVAIITFTGP